MNSAHPYSSSSDLLQWLLFFGLIWCVWSLRGSVIVLGFSAAAALHLSVLGLQRCDRICRELLQLQLYVVSRCMPCLARLMLICIEDCAAGVRWLLWCSSVFVYVYSFVGWWASLMVCLLVCLHVSLFVVVCLLVGVRVCEWQVIRQVVIAMLCAPVRCHAVSWGSSWTLDHHDCYVLWSG